MDQPANEFRRFGCFVFRWLGAFRGFGAFAFRRFGSFGAWWRFGGFTFEGQIVQPGVDERVVERVLDFLRLGAAPFQTL